MIDSIRNGEAKQELIGCVQFQPIFNIVFGRLASMLNNSLGDWKYTSFVPMQNAALYMFILS